MLNRHKAFLALLKQAGGSGSRLHLTNWCFLLNRETSTGGGDAFYHFVPYLHGPYSFCLHDEVASLVDDGHVMTEEVDSWTITDAGSKAAEDLDDDVQRDVSSIVSKYGTWRTNELTGYISDAYPWFTLNSVKGARTVRSLATPAVYSAGYEGFPVDGFLNFLLENGMVRFIDVRGNPVSGEFGFQKNTLDSLCAKVGLEYSHFPELGVQPKESTTLSTDEDYHALFNGYDRDVLSCQYKAIESVALLARAKPSVLVCMESDSACCHRSRLAESVAEAANLPIRHLKQAA